MRPTILGLLLLALTAAPARAQEAVITQQVFDRAGNPSLVVNSSPNGEPGRVSWRVCPDGREPCSAGPSSNFFEAGETPAGAVFEATIAYDEGRTSTDRSDAWGGRVAPVAPPRLEGSPEVGATVRAVSGTWTGGWGDEFDERRVEACRTPDGGSCERVCAPDRSVVEGQEAVAVPSRYRGWYLRAAVQRIPRESASPSVATICRAGVPALEPGPTVAVSAASGPVTGPPMAAPPIVRSGPPLEPSATVRRRSYVGARGLVVGRVRCAASCRVRLVVTDRRGRTARRAFATVGSAALAVPRRSVGTGRLQVRVTVDGRPVTSGVSRR